MLPDGKQTTKNKMKIEIIIRMDNAAFDEGNAGQEAARILRELAGDLADGRLAAEDDQSLRDFNGNNVGRAVFAE